MTLGTTRVWLSSVGSSLSPEDPRARVSVFDRGFLYGDSVYETLRTYGGRPLDWNAHILRLRRSASGIGFSIPFEEEEIAAAVDRCLADAGDESGGGPQPSPGPEFRVRIVVTRGTGPIALDTRKSQDPLLVVYVEPLVLPPAEAYEHGIRAAIVDVSAARADVGLKTGNYLANILALREAIERAGEDAIMCNEQGEIAEAASSNLFMVEHGRVYTPPVSAGLLEGITRARVIELARAVGLQVEEAAILPVRLRSAEEVFLTSSVRGIMAVTVLDGSPVGEGTVGTITRSIAEAYTADLARRARLD